MEQPERYDDPYLPSDSARDRSSQRFRLTPGKALLFSIFPVAFLFLLFFAMLLFQHPGFTWWPAILTWLLLTASILPAGGLAAALAALLKAKERKRNIVMFLAVVMIAINGFMMMTMLSGVKSVLNR